nr:PP2C family protein-serine/threonine phosphatase [Streptomyces californicus]
MNRRTDIEAAVRAAPPHALLAALRTALISVYGALAVDLYLADYGLRVLKSLDRPDDEPLSLDNSPEGRAFGSQEAREQQVRHDDAVDHLLPVTVRGERLGILTVRLPQPLSTPGVALDLAHAADLLGHEILVAERDTDLYQRARRTSRLTLALSLIHSAIHGDNFDWAADADELTVAVTNGMGEGIQASLLTNLAVNALRNARRAGIGIADQAALADQAIYDQHRGASHVSTLLLRFELATGKVGVVDAGSPQLWMQRGRLVRRLELDAQLPLGMFEESQYAVQEFHVEPGDRLMLFSDGVYDAVSPQGEAYGERMLARSIQSTRLLPAATAPRAVLADLAAYRGTETLDDALVLCLDWFGRQRD